MLVELAVRDLGAIAEVSLSFGSGATALTGETGAGKTMIVEALSLLLGGRADPARVRSGAETAEVEARFATGHDDGDEVVLRRVVPRSGRSRAYVNGRLATLTELAEHGRGLIEVLGQHSHQRLLSPASQREALDRFGGIDLGELRAATAQRAAILAELESLGGDERTRARELDLLRYQAEELAAAHLVDADEDERLSDEEDVLSDAVAHREAAARAADSLGVDGGAGDLVGVAVSALDGRAPFDELVSRARAVQAELGDIAAELRSLAEGIEDDPRRLDEIRTRRQALVELRRKYGERLADVIEYEGEVAERIAALEGHEAAVSRLTEQLERVEASVAAAEASVAAARRAAAPALADAVTARFDDVALSGARLEVRVGGDGPANDVEYLFSPAPTVEARPLARTASGGELSRTMLAVYLTMSEGAPTAVFDEVDAGIGGGAATEIGRSLAALGLDRQVLVVTHLPQVAAFADQQLQVRRAGDDLAVSTVVTLEEDDRVVELSRMLAGSPDSSSARTHARELLTAAAAERGSDGV